ncbi:ABC transporter permease [Helicobacter marmotae]|uniref:ABC transporter permease n=1 Tax=Helicobacter marmotae TaxID=152490 RepID=A0A3D8I809_9HELI|nr:ABC transporter permease [Helicobacter marmotae]RDU60661.1 ABC transporter permease [Helicobacter marmotae]
MNALTLYLLPRYLRFDKTQPFISITALLAFFGVGIGVMVLCVAMAIMNGMSKEFERKLFVMNYPLSVYSTTHAGVDDMILQALKEQFPDFLFSPYLRYQAVAKVNNSMNAAMVFGVDMYAESQINEVVSKAFEPSHQIPTEQEREAFKTQAINTFKNKTFSILVGKGLEEHFNLQVDDKLDFFFTQLEPSGFSYTPINKRFAIAGFFESGLRAYDEAYTYTNLEALQKIRRIPDGVYDGIHIYTPNPMQDIHAISAFLKLHFPNRAGIEGWWQQNGNFFSALELEKRALFIVLMLIIVMASLNIISSLLMVVMNRRKEIALLLSLGASRQEIRKTFFWVGNTIGLSGIMLGIVLTGIAMYVLDTFPIISLPADVYGSSKLPLDLSWLDFSLTIIGASLIVCLSSYYPAKKAALIDTLQVLRNE